jgi:D-serine deaminase-like pyridoxal phosphate-dependent protein
MKQTASLEKPWYHADNVIDVPSPSLLVYPDRIEQNIRKMIQIAGDADRLRPHVKTHKMSEVVRLQLKHGINKFKCATISEAEMLAMSGAKDILLAIQPVGPNMLRFFKLKQAFPVNKISCIADNADTIRQLSDMSVKTSQETNVWLDINNGMNRTGIAPGDDAARLYKMIITKPGLKAEGFHVYDGHIHDSEFSIRQRICNESFVPVNMFIDELTKDGIPPAKIVAGGTPSFPVHALRQGVECSPGTLILWDYKSCSSFSEMDFLYAAVLITRVVSKPGKDLICLDLGHKAIGSEMPHPRLKIFGIEDFTVLNHSEEHMVIRTSVAENYSTGDILYCIPSHICPTVALHDTVSVVTENRVTGQWNVDARRRKITI